MRPSCLVPRVVLCVAFASGFVPAEPPPSHPRARRSDTYRVSVGGRAVATELTRLEENVQLEMNIEEGMTITINVKALRATLPEVVRRVRKGARFTVIYRSRPAFQIVPLDYAAAPSLPLQDDPLYRARPVGRSKDGRTAADHDALLYP
jgi:antitoxin (DNA-binding transcriptional repressor) of toxin-antitoxin stability system